MSSPLSATRCGVSILVLFTVCVLSIMPFVRCQLPIAWWAGLIRLPRVADEVLARWEAQGYKGIPVHLDHVDDVIRANDQGTPLSWGASVAGAGAVDAADGVAASTRPSWDGIFHSERFAQLLSELGTAEAAAEGIAPEGTTTGAALSQVPVAEDDSIDGSAWQPESGMIMDGEMPAAPADAVSAAAEPYAEPSLMGAEGIQDIAVAQVADCTMNGSSYVGNFPRATAIIFFRYSRQHYPSDLECCKASCARAGNPQGCHTKCEAGCTDDNDLRRNETCPQRCTWGGYTWSRFPDPTYASRMFWDGCDGRMSMNEAMFKMTNGAITFHGNASRGSPPSVYGWATLDRMRVQYSGLYHCTDWCAEAQKQLRLEPTSHQHWMCMPLYNTDFTASPDICEGCDPADKANCRADSCPKSSRVPFGAGCGCGTCFYAWGTQPEGCMASPNTISGPQYTAFGAPMDTYVQRPSWWTAEPVPPGSQRYLFVAEGIKRFVLHELGHNLRLYHAGAIFCNNSAGSLLARAPGDCFLDAYRDCTSFMGCGGIGALSNFQLMQKGWLRTSTMRTISFPSNYRGNGVQHNLSALTLRTPTTNVATRWWNSEVLTLSININSKVPVAGSWCTGDPFSSSCQKAIWYSRSWPYGCCTAPTAPEQDPAVMRSYYVEIFRPLGRDFQTLRPGVVIRLGPGLQDCATAPWLAAGNSTGTGPNAERVWVLNRPGQVFRDTLRRVVVRLARVGPDMRWAQVVVTPT